MYVCLISQSNDRYIWQNDINVDISIEKKKNRDGSVVSVSACHVEGHGNPSQPGHTKDHHKYGTNCLPAWHAGIRPLGQEFDSAARLSKRLGAMWSGL